MIYDLIIIGSGVAGLSAGIYAGRYQMKTLIITGNFGGESALGGVFWNYPGTGPIDGYELVKKMKEQAKASGVEFVDGKVADVKQEGGLYRVGEYTARAVVLANGAERRKLGLPNEKELTGKGVHYCVTCDGPVYIDKTIAMVGGGDAAIKGVNLVGQYVKKVYVLVKDPEIIAEPINYEEMKKLGEKVEVVTNIEIKEIVGGEKVEKLVLSKPINGSNELVVDGVFIEIGAVPSTELAKSLGVVLDDRGYVVVDREMKTNVPGVFAAGDTANFFGSFKQAITAAAMGAVAASSAYKYCKQYAG